jgi:streptomycin 6-kinase
MITIPAEFAAGIQFREGDAGRDWLAALPNTVADLCQRWTLAVEGQPWHGHLAIVVPVRRHAESCALKVSWQDTDTVHEAHALKLWNGRDTVRLLESAPDHGAMLLERLDAQRTLFDLPLDLAVPVAGAIARNLSVPGDATLPTVAGLAAEITRTVPERWERLGRPVPPRLIDEAIELASALRSSPATTMVNWDLHYGNVLFSPARKAWLAIDPKPVTGAPESGIAQLLWTRIADIAGAADLHRHLDALIDSAGLDAGQTRAWTRVRVVDFWLWELSVGLTHDPGGCATILDWLGHR